MSKHAGIYVEILMNADIARVWQLSQTPDLHQRWDLRFTRIQYLHRPDPHSSQQFVYETRIGFGLTIRGTGESLDRRSLASGEATSSLKFASDDPKSLIREGSGYWRYVPTSVGTRFFTWYDYRVRFGAAGRLFDRLVFRMLMGWATAWSFDCLRLWAESEQPPETSLRLSAIHSVARITIAVVWIWHGLVPKLLFHNRDELLMLQRSGLPDSFVNWFGGAEVLLGLLMLLFWRWRPAFLFTGALMVLATAGVSLSSPEYLRAAFNPVTLNGAVLALSVVGFVASKRLPTAARCLRSQPGENG